MSTRRVLTQAGVLALVAAYPFAVVLDPWQGLAVLAAATLAMGNYLLMAGRLRGTTGLLSRPSAPGYRAVTAQTMIGSGIRWLITFFLLWGLLSRAEAMAVVAGLSCVVASITLQALFEYLRAVRGPSAGAVGDSDPD